MHVRLLYVWPHTHVRILSHNHMSWWTMQTPHHICMYVWIYIYMHALTDPMRVSDHVDLCVCMHVCMYGHACFSRISWICVTWYVRVCIHIHIYTHTYVQLQSEEIHMIYTYIYTHVYTYIYTHVYIHTCTHAHVYINTYIPTAASWCRRARSFIVSVPDDCVRITVHTYVRVCVRA